MPRDRIERSTPASQDVTVLYKELILLVLCPCGAQGQLNG